MTVQLTKDTFDREVLEEKRPVIIDFWASWCGPCRMQSPILDEAAQELGDQVKVCKLNVDEEPTIAVDFQVSSIPTLVYLKDGKTVNRMIGVQTKETIVSALQSMLDA